MKITQMLLRGALAFILASTLAACGDTSTQSGNDHGHSHE
jgi:uncharacterized lipoprotein YehR (DUF1307 family)